METMHVEMNVRGVSHQTSHEALGHRVVSNTTKFQNCRTDDKFFIGEKPLRFWREQYVFNLSDV